MYVWLWRRLPGGVPGKLAGCALLLLGLLTLLFLVVFPWVEPRLPLGDVTVDGDRTVRPSPSATPSPTPPSS